MNTDFGFYFEKAGMSAVQGATSSAEEHFKEVTMAEALVREMGQNSLDAKATENQGPVRMQFELRNLKTGEIPDYRELRRHVIAADEATRHIDATNTRLVTAAEATDLNELPVLRIGDYGTTGLTGHENDNTNDSPIVALTRSRGISSGKQGKGGSFGVGAVTGALSSAIRTVLWTTLAEDSDEVVFAGQSQLATHDLDGVRRGPDGFFIDRADRSGFHYLRSPDPIGGFSPRKENGTDTYILGYLDANADPNLFNIRAAFVRNFFVAIDRGLLEVEGITPSGNWTLNSKTLGELVRTFDDVYPFYKALHSEPISGEIEGFGKCELYMEFDSSLPKKLDTIAMRAPLMKVTTFSHHSIRAKYAAIFLGEDEPLNSKLRTLEPPAHDKWVPKRAEYGSKLVSKVKEFIREGLKTQLSDEIGEEIQIEEMDRLLPSGLGKDNLDIHSYEGTSTDRETGNDESDSVHGDDSTPAVKQSKRQIYEVGPRTSARSGQGDPAMGGLRKNSGHTAKSSGGSADVVAEKGDGSAKILETDVRMRSWTEASTGDLIVVLRASEAGSGDLTLAALRDGGEPEKDFTLPIQQAYVQDGQDLVEIEFEGNTIHGVEIDPDTLSTTLRLKLSNSQRFRLGVV
ncbi:hypothetical protein [Corynebacterium urinipleomorphum]|uniref:hypothetical protein n=1 Tax=Corynebacterium urinipleomorphum TaxID=1852380 RepID=UPI000B3510C1|nr:hypothetical protein [Corynebacterium urinipleomorphum]